jgi:Ala-tRNA(Pro) deacylase
MTIANRVKWYLDAHHIEYELVPHEHSSTSLESARAARVPSGRVVKCVLLEDERGYLMAIVPASCRVDLEEIGRQLGRHLTLASEAELGEIFDGCEIGAVPPIGDAYNIPTAIDDALLRLPDVYFEAGDHEELVHVSRKAFAHLLPHTLHGRYSRPN